MKTKKITFFMLAVAFSLNSLYAQIFNAGFEDNNGTPLSEFKTINNDGNEVPSFAEILEFNEEAWIQFYDGPDNKIAMSTSYYINEVPSDDWLITPEIEIPDSGTPTLYWKAKSYELEQTDSYEVLISTTDDEMESFQDTLMSVQDEQAFDFNERSVDLSDYKGETVHIAYVNNTTGGYYLGLDDLYISETDDCILPETENIEVNDLDENGFTVSWNEESEVDNYDVGLTTFDTPVSSEGEQSDNTKEYTDLEPGTRYQFFLKNADCGSGWTSPVSIRTASLLPYEYDFEETEENFGEYDSDGWTSTTWLNSSGEDRAQSGDGYIFNNTNDTYDTDAWIFTPAMKLEEGEEVIVKFYTEMGGENADPANLNISIAEGPDKSDNLEIIEEVEVDFNEYEKIEVSYTADEEGVFYFGFGNVTPQVTNEGPLRLDNIEITTEELSVEEPEASQFSIYPNPASAYVNVAFKESFNQAEVTVFDMNGRKVIKESFEENKEQQINTSGLNSGIYFMEFNIDGKNTTEKLIIK